MTLLVVWAVARYTHGPWQPTEEVTSTRTKCLIQDLGTQSFSIEFIWIYMICLRVVVGKQQRLGEVSLFHSKPSGNRWALSLSLLEGSPLRRLEMTVVGSSAAISACASGPWQRALWLFDEWLGCDFFPPVLGNTGSFLWRNWPEKCETRLPQKDLTPDIIVCNSVLRACAFANAEHLERLLCISVVVLEQLFWFFFPDPQQIEQKARLQLQHGLETTPTPPETWDFCLLFYHTSKRYDTRACSRTRCCYL